MLWSSLPHTLSLTYQTLRISVEGKKCVKQCAKEGNIIIFEYHGRVSGKGGPKWKWELAEQWWDDMGKNNWAKRFIGCGDEGKREVRR